MADTSEYGNFPFKDNIAQYRQINNKLILRS